MTSAAEALATAYRATYDPDTPAGPEDHEFAATLIAGLADKGFQVVLIPDEDQPVPAPTDRLEYWMRQLSLPVGASYSQVVAAMTEIGSLNTRRAIMASCDARVALP
jgi:hypothetical protein